MNSIEELESAFTSKHWSWEYLNPADCPSSLLQALREKLTHIDSRSWQARFELGGVYVNGLLAAPDTQLSAPCRVEYYEPKFDLTKAVDFFPKFSKQQIVFEDPDLLAVYKPQGISCMPARDQNVFHLKAQLEEYLGHVIHMPSRIDMSTQGLVIVSCSERMHKHLQHAFQFRRIEKKYLLLTAKAPTWEEFNLEADIGRDPNHPVLRKVNGKAPRPAQTIFKVLKRNSDGSALIEANPKTGRTHQIRVHASHLGHAICGDKFYGGRAAAGLHLLSFSLSLRHPFSGEQLSLNVPDKYRPEWSKA